MKLSLDVDKSYVIKQSYQNPSVSILSPILQPYLISTIHITFTKPIPKRLGLIREFKRGE